MPDYRTKRQKLEAMASQTVSPNEAAIARAKLGQQEPDRPVGRKTSRRYIVNYPYDPEDPEVRRKVWEAWLRMMTVPSDHFSDDS